MAYPLPTAEEKARIAQLEALEAIRQEGNRRFAQGNWTGAIAKYSMCINLAGGKMEVEHDMEKARKDGVNSIANVAFNHLLALAYSNRAEARLRLHDYKGALDDAKKALKVDLQPKHVKTLVRKGKAAHGLELYSKACEAFKAALKESPGEKSILKLLKESTVAVEQSCKGDYELAEYFCRGCTDPVPVCADYVGPVEIRRANRSDGRRRGLFATRDLEPAELLIVNNPIAAGRQKCKKNVLDPDEERGEGGFDIIKKEFPEKLLSELVEKLQKSNLQLVRFSSLASDDIPSMELFKPESGRVPPNPVDEELDEEFIADIARKRMFHYVQSNSCARNRYPESTEIAGLWILPAFANHSCAPNCQHNFVGKTIFFRANQHIKEGDELTVSYNSDIFEDVMSRKETMQNWLFTCKCERCLVEKKLAPQLRKISVEIEEKRKRHYLTVKEVGVTADDILGGVEGELSNAADEVEKMIQTIGKNLQPRQQAWIRASYTALYMSKVLVPNAELEEFEMAVMAQSSVYITPSVLQLATQFLGAVEQYYPKESRTFQTTIQYVMRIYTLYFGRQREAVLRILINNNMPNHHRPI
ncbi:unnamed protein product [Calypogeia fissa]